MPHGATTLIKFSGMEPAPILPSRTRPVSAGVRPIVRIPPCAVLIPMLACGLSSDSMVLSRQRGGGTKADGQVAVSSYDNFFLLPCSLQSWCCCGYKGSGNCDVAACCANNFTLASGPGSVIRVLGSGSSSGTSANGSNGDPTTSMAPGSPGASTSGGIVPLGTTNPSFSTCAAGSGSGSGSGSSNSSNGTTTAAIVGGVLGSLFLATAVALGFVLFRNRQLSRDIAAAQPSQMVMAPKAEIATPPVQGTPVYYHHNVHPANESGNIQRISEMQSYERPRSELPGQNWQT